MGVINILCCDLMNPTMIEYNSLYFDYIILNILDELLYFTAF